MEKLHSLLAVIAVSVWRLLASSVSKALLLFSDRVIRKKAKPQPRYFARKELPQKAWALMLTNRKIIGRLTIASRKSTGRLDILVNNAGILKEGEISATGSGPNPVTAVSLEMLRETFETNFFASVALTQKLLPLIRQSPAGRIVNVSSILSSLTLHSDPNSPIYPFKTFAYDASKAALNSFTVHLAYELRDSKIKVNSAHPGWVKTEMGGPNATMEVSEGGKTSAQLATLADDGPSGGFFHLGQPLPW